MPDHETEIMAQHLLTFLRTEVQAGRLTESLAPLQSGIGSVANAVLHGMIDSEFEDLEVYSEVLQDAVFDLIDAGKVRFASCASITFLKRRWSKCLITLKNIEISLLCVRRKFRIIRKLFVVLA